MATREILFCNEKVPMGVLSTEMGAPGGFRISVTGGFQNSVGQHFEQADQTLNLGLLD